MIQCLNLELNVAPKERKKVKIDHVKMSPPQIYELTIEKDESR